MKNRKGSIAAFLTLGLVVVGTLVTLGTSLFVSNKKTSLALNSKAAGKNVCCLASACGVGCGPNQKKVRYVGSYDSACSENYKSTNCSAFGATASVGVTGTCVEQSSCKPSGSFATAGINGSASGGAIKQCEYKSEAAAIDACGSSGITAVGCSKTFLGKQTYKCKSGSASGGSTDPLCTYSNATEAKSDCEPNGYTNLGCGKNSAGKQTYKCKDSTTSGAVSSGSSAFQCAVGDSVVADGTCSETCSSAGSTYVSNSQGTGSDGNHYCCCKKTEVGKGLDTCYKAYRPGLYSCEAPDSKIVIYAPSMAAVGMSSCSAYNKEAATALYFAGVPGKYSDGQCATVWTGAMDLGTKNEEAENQANDVLEEDGDLGELNVCDPVSCETGNTSNSYSKMTQQFNTGPFTLYYRDDSCNNKVTSEAKAIEFACGGSNAGTENPQCEPKSCRNLNNLYPINNEYVEKNGAFYKSKKDCQNNNEVSFQEVEINCSKSMTTQYDNSCKEQANNPLAYCPYFGKSCNDGFEKSSTISCGIGGKCCVPKANSQACIQKSCKTLGSDFPSGKSYYIKNGSYFKDYNSCTSGNSYTYSQVVFYCSVEGILQPYDNICRTKTKNPFSYCPNLGFCKSGYKKSEFNCVGASSNFGTQCCIPDAKKVEDISTIQCNGDITYDEQGNIICVLN